MSTSIIKPAQAEMPEAIQQLQRLLAECNDSAAWSGPQGAVHGHFGLTYASWCTIPRFVLQSMPDWWQRAFVLLLQQLDQTIDWCPHNVGLNVVARELVERKDSTGMKYGKRVQLMDDAYRHRKRCELKPKPEAGEAPATPMEIARLRALATNVIAAGTLPHGTIARDLAYAECFEDARAVLKGGAS